MSSSAKAIISERLLALTDAACTSELDSAALVELATLLRAEPAARRFYAEYCRLHAELYFAVRAERAVRAAGGQRGERGERREEWEDISPESPDSRIPESPIVNPQIPTLHSPLSTLHSWAVSYAVATLLVSIALLGAWFSTITHPDVDSLLADANSRRLTASGGADNETPQFTFVGKVSGMVDCRFADSSTSTIAGAGVTLGRRYALKSGLMEISYDSGAKVILQGPCEYTVESRSSGYLQVGKLVARMGAGDGGRGTREATNLPSPASGRGSGGEGGRNRSQSALTLALPQGERGHNLSPTPHAPQSTPLFSVRTLTALIEDLGTEFGVEVLETGDTSSHVFQGRVVVRTEGSEVKGQGSGDENNKSEIRNQKSEIVLSAGQSARVEKDTKSGELKLLSGDKLAATKPEQDKFVRRLREPPKELDLLDIVAGGNGLGNRRERGIDPMQGGLQQAFMPEHHQGDGRYVSVYSNMLIDGVFIPKGDGRIRLDSDGHFFDKFPQTSGKTFGAIWARSAMVKSYDPTRDPGFQHWVYAVGPGETFMPEDRGMLCLHANAAITFNLKAIRVAHRGFMPRRFSAVAGLGDAKRLEPSADGMADLWIFVDGRLAHNHMRLCQQDGPLAVSVEIKPESGYLTIAVTDGGNGIMSDWFVLGDPLLHDDEASSTKE